MRALVVWIFCFFFNDTATTEIYTLSLHDALPIFDNGAPGERPSYHPGYYGAYVIEDRKSTRLNSSHEWISYAVFCLKKKTDDASDEPASQRTGVTGQAPTSRPRRRPGMTGDDIRLQAADGRAERADTEFFF